MKLNVLLIFALLSSNFVLIIATNHFEQAYSNNAQMKTLYSLFQTTIAPLYGDQEEALKKISDAKDRLAYLLVNEEKVLGVLVYKNTVTQEFALLGVDDAIELKTLFVVDAKTNSGIRLGTQLFNKCLEYAKSVKAGYIVVTVSEEKPESIKFFERKGFKKIDAMPNKYKVGVTEYIFAKSLKIND